MNLYGRWGLVVLLLAGGLGGGQSASAQYFGRNKVQYDQFQFEVLPTNHFDLYFYEETTTAARDAARMADRWYARHSTIFSHELTARRPLIFYANDPDFQQTTIAAKLMPKVSKVIIADLPTTPSHHRRSRVLPGPLSARVGSGDPT